MGYGEEVGPGVCGLERKRKDTDGKTGEGGQYDLENHTPCGLMTYIIIFLVHLSCL